MQEGALLQLWRGYRAFLGEQAHQLQLGLGAGALPESAQSLQGLVAARGKFSAEVGELVSLAENPDSWFFPMAAAWGGLWRSAAAAGKPASDGAIPPSPPGVQTLIPLRQLEASSNDVAPVIVDADRLMAWLRALTELVQRQRVQGEEW